MTQSKSGGGKKSNTTTSRIMLTFASSIFTIIRSVVGWRARGRLAVVECRRLGRHGGRHHQGGPFPWCGHELNDRFSRRRVGFCTACSKWHTVSDSAQPSRGTRAKEILAELALKHWKNFQANYMTPLIAMGVLERTISDKPRSCLHRYQTTAAGLAALEDSAEQVDPSRPQRFSRREAK